MADEAILKIILQDDPTTPMPPPARQTLQAASAAPPPPRQAVETPGPRPASRQAAGDSSPRPRAETPTASSTSARDALAKLVEQLTGFGGILGAVAKVVLALADLRGLTATAKAANAPIAQPPAVPMPGKAAIPPTVQTPAPPTAAKPASPPAVSPAPTPSTSAKTTGAPTVQAPTPSTSAKTTNAAAAQMPAPSTSAKTTNAAAAQMPAPSTSAEAAVAGEAAGGEAAAAAEGGAGLAGAAAAAAGPIGAALAVAVAVKQVVGKVVEAFHDAGAAAARTGQVLSQFAANDNFGAITTAAEGASNMLGKLGPAGEMAGAALGAVVTSAKAYNQVIDAFVARGKELQRYSPELSAANTIASMRSLLADFRESQELGPGLARLTDAQSRLSDEFRELLLPIKQFLVEHLADWLNMLAEIVRDIKGGIVGVEEGFHQIGILLNDAFGSGHIRDIPEHLKNLPAAIGEAVERAKKKKDRFDVILLEQMRRLGLEPLPHPRFKNPLEGAAEQELDIPMLRL